MSLDARVTVALEAQGWSKGTQAVERGAKKAGSAAAAGGEKIDRFGKDAEGAGKRSRKAAGGIEALAKRVRDIRNLVGADILARWGREGLRVVRQLVAQAVLYRDAFTQINTLVGVGSQQTTEWHRQILELGPAVGQLPVAMGQAMFVINSAGERGSTALNLLEEAGKGAAVGLGGAIEVARVGTSVIQAYGRENITAAKANEILFQTVREGNLEARTLAPVLGRVIPVAAELGVTFGEVGGFVATLTRLNGSAAESVTSLKAVLQALIKPSSEGLRVLQDYGTSIEEVRRSIRERGLAATLTGLIELFDGNVEALSALIPSSEALAGVLGTAKSQGEEYLRIERAIVESSGELDSAFRDVKENSPKFAFQQLTAQAQATAIAFSGGLAEALAETAREMSQVLSESRDLAVFLGQQLGEGIRTTVTLGEMAAERLGLVRTSLLGIFQAAAGVSEQVTRPLEGSAEAAAQNRKELVAMAGPLGGVVEQFLKLSDMRLAALEGDLRGILQWVRGAAGPLGFMVDAVSRLSGIGPLSIEGQLEQLHQQFLAETQLVGELGNQYRALRAIQGKADATQVEQAERLVKTISERLEVGKTSLAQARDLLGQVEGGTEAYAQQARVVEEMAARVEELEGQMFLANREYERINGLREQMERSNVEEQVAIDISKLVQQIRDVTEAHRGELRALAEGEEAHADYLRRLEAIKLLLGENLPLREDLIAQLVAELRERDKAVEALERYRAKLAEVEELRRRVAAAMAEAAIQERVAVTLPVDVEWTEEDAAAMQEMIEESLRRNPPEVPVTLAQQAFEDFASNLQGLLADTFERIFQGDLVGSLKSALKEATRLFLRMLAEWAAAAAAQKFAVNVASEGGTTTGGAGFFSTIFKGAGKVLGGTSSAGTAGAVAGWLAIYAAIWEIGSSVVKSKEFEQATQGYVELEILLGRADSQIRSAGSRVWSQLNELGNNLADQVNSIVAAFGGNLQAVGDVGLRVRKGKYFDVLVNGLVTKFGEDYQAAMEFALVQTLKQADIAGLAPEVQQVLAGTNARTVAELQQQIELAQAMADGYSEAAREARTRVAQLRQEVEVMRESGVSLEARIAHIENGAEDIWNIYRELTGKELDLAARQQRELEGFNRWRKRLFEQWVRELETLLALQGKAGEAVAIGGERLGGLFIDAGEAAGRFGEDVAGLADVLNSAGRVIGFGADDVADRIAELRALLANLPPEIKPGEVKGPRRGFGPSRADQVAQLRDELGGINLSGLSDPKRSVREVLAQIDDIKERTSKYGEVAEEAAQAVAVLTAQLRDQFSEVVSEALNQPFDPDRGLNQQLIGIRQKYKDLNDANEDHLKLTGELAIARWKLIKAEEAEKRALGEAIVNSFGLPSVQLAQDLADLGSKVSFLRENFEELGFTLEEVDGILAEVGQMRFLNLAEGMNQYVKNEDVKRKLEQISFMLKVANWKKEIEVLKALGILTEEQIAILEGLLEDIKNNPPDFSGGDDPTVPTTQVGSILPPTWQTDAQSFIDQLLSMQNAANSNLSPIRSIQNEMDELRDRAQLMRLALLGMGYSMEEVLGIIEEIEGARIAQVLEQALDPLRRIQDELAFGSAEYSGLTPRAQFEQAFAQVRSLFDQAQAGDPEQRYQAIQQLQQLVPQLLSMAPSALGQGGAAVASFRQFMQQALALITGYTPAFPTGLPTLPPGVIPGRPSDTPGLAGSTDQAGHPVLDGNVIVAGGAFAGQGAAVDELRGLRAEVRDLRRELADLVDETRGRRADAAEQADAAQRGLTGLSKATGRVAGKLEAGDGSFARKRRAL